MAKHGQEERETESGELEAMQDFIKNTMKSLGVDVSFDQDEELSSYTKGKPLIFGMLKSYPEESVVWLDVYDRDDCNKVIHSGPYKVYKGAGNSLCFDDGTCFGVDIECGADDQPAEDEYKKVYRAIKLKE